MNIIIMGPAGSGKGSQAKLLVKKLNYQYFECGDVLREKSREKSPLGRKIDRIIHQKGELVPDEIMAKIVDNWLEKIDIRRGIIFDGFPRNLSQYRLLKKILAVRNLKIDRVISLKVSKEVSIQRLSKRRICPKCDLEYNLVTKPPKEDELCDQCRVKLIQRQDDTPRVIETRLAIYRKTTSRLVEFIHREGILEEIDGERPVEPIFAEILARLKTPKHLGGGEATTSTPAR